MKAVTTDRPLSGACSEFASVPSARSDSAETRKRTNARPNWRCSNCHAITGTSAKRTRVITFGTLTMPGSPRHGRAEAPSTGAAPRQAVAIRRSSPGRGGAPTRVTLRAAGAQFALRVSTAALARLPMEFTLEQRFPAGLERLWSVFGQAEYPLRKYLALGARAVRLHRFDVTAQTIEVDLERDVAVDRAQLPAWTRAWVGPTQTLGHRTRWRRTGPRQAEAELEIKPEGLPVLARGRARIVEEAPGSTTLQLTWQVTSNAPLVGAAVARLFAEQVRSALEADHAFTLRYLAEAAPRGGR